MLWYQHDAFAWRLRSRALHRDCTSKRTQSWICQTWILYGFDSSKRFYVLDVCPRKFSARMTLDSSSTSNIRRKLSNTPLKWETDTYAENEFEGPWDEYQSSVFTTSCYDSGSQFNDGKQQEIMPQIAINLSFSRGTSSGIVHVFELRILRKIFRVQQDARMHVHGRDLRLNRVEISNLDKFTACLISVE